MELNQLKATLEAVLFAYAEPVSTVRLAEALDVERDLVERVLRQMQDELGSADRGIQLIQLEGDWQLATKSEFGDQIKAALDTRRNVPLSAAALEVLAIIAYNQPVSRSFIEQVRGVDSSSTVAGLTQKGLVEEAGRMDLPGRPLAFKTTDVFLRTFGISSLTELPPLHTGEEAAGEAGLYERPDGAEEYDAEDAPETRALRGGTFIEGEGGAAALIGEEE